MAQRWYVYMLACRGGSLYTGVAVDVVARYAMHAAGAGAAYTRANPPRGILAARRCADRGAAQKLEHALKQLERPDKLAWARRNPFVGRRIHRDTRAKSGV